MSWSVSFTGRPEKVAEAIEAESAKLSGQSKVEYDAAKPHLAALVRQNFAREGSGYNEPLIEVSAHGSGASRTPVGKGEGAPPEQVQSQVAVSIKPVHTKLLL